MASQIDICNTALRHVGIRAGIGSLSEQSEEARVIRLVYDQVLERTLEKVDWGFARRRATLTLLETQPNIFWAFRYELPVDCAVPRQIQPFVRNPSNEDLIPWEIESATDPTKRTLLTDVASATLIYTRRDVPPGAYPQHFIHALAWVLADEIAMPLTAKAEVAQLASQGARLAVLEGGAMAMNKGQPDLPQDSEFVRARS